MASKKPKPSSPPPTAIEQHERSLAAAALTKLRDSKQPTAKELAALKRLQAAEERASARRHYRAIPKGEWLRMSGRQAKIVNAQAAHYGLPMGGPEIDLEAFLPAFHQFLADNARRFASAEASDPEHAARVRKLELQNAAAEVRLAKELRQLVSLKFVDDLLGEVSGRVSGVIENLQRSGDARAAVMIRAALEDALRGAAKRKELADA